MTSISNFDSQVYSEETYPVTESEYDEVMSLMAEESEAMTSYGEWSSKLEIVNESENFYVTADNKVHHKPEPKSNGRLEGIEI